MSNETAIAVRELVLSLVAIDIQVSVYVDRVLPRDARSAAGPARAMAPGGARISVEMIGPDNAVTDGERPLMVRSEAHAWCNEEILSAVRRAAERIMRAHPDWRRRPH